MFTEWRKNMKNKEKITEVCYFVASICFYLTSFLNFSVINNVGLGVVYLCLGSIFLCLGVAQINKIKAKKQENEAQKDETFENHSRN